jgi:uncharacterized DUF497 family protein
VIAIGQVDGITLTLVHTDRPLTVGGVERRIISARASSRKERQAYDSAIQAS